MHGRLTFAALLLLAAFGCGQAEAPADSAAEHDDSWAVTAWGERYEVFAETDGLIAGTAVTSNAHVTILDGFAPLTEGSVAAVLRAAGPGDSFSARIARSGTVSTPSRSCLPPKGPTSCSSRLTAPRVAKRSPQQAACGSARRHRRGAW